MSLGNENTESLKKVLTAAGGSVNGKKKLQKLVYLCQASGTDLGLDFTFHYYGVYSPSLSSLLHDAEESERVKVIDYINAPTQISLVGAADASLDLTSPGLQLVAQLKDRSARVLEVLSTIVYLKERGYEGLELKTKLEQLKGHLSEFYVEAFALAEEHFHIAA